MERDHLESQLAAERKQRSEQWQLNRQLTVLKVTPLFLPLFDLFTLIIVSPILH